MPRDHLLYIDDILESILHIREYTSGMNYQEFSSDRKTIDAVLRNLEVIGEAAKNIPIDIQSENQGIEWKKITGLRNILIHQYFGVNTMIIWDIIQNKLSQLEVVCNKLLT